MLEGKVMDMTGLIVNLISGAVGGNAAGAAMPARWETPWRAWREVELWE